MNKVGNKIENPNTLRKYDIVALGSIVCSVIIFSHNLLFVEPICKTSGTMCVGNGINGLDEDFRLSKKFKYQPINEGKYYAYNDLHKECILLKHNKGKRPTLEEVLAFVSEKYPK